MYRYTPKVLAAVFTAVLLNTLMPVQAMAAETASDVLRPATTATALKSGGCGAGCEMIWVAYDDGTVTITGDGAMMDYHGNESFSVSDDGWSAGLLYTYSDFELLGDYTIKYVIINEGVTNIGDCAFIEQPDIEYVSLPSSLQRIGDVAFGGCTNLTEITLPEGLTEIGSGAFVYCGLTSIRIPDGIKAIEEVTFSGCTNLKSVTIPDSVTRIGIEAFSDCGLTSISIPTGVEAIRERTFLNCTDLKIVTIPDSVTSIAVDAFSNCGSLTDVYYPGTQAEWDTISIATGNDDLLGATIHVKPSINTQPTNVNTVAGKTAKFTVDASGTGLTYQWQFRKNSTGTWTNSTITGCTTNTIKVSATAARNGYQYRCIIKDSSGKKLTSKAATLNVLAITAQPKAVTAAAGTTAQMSVTATGTGLTYQWQFRKNSTGTWTNSTTTGYNTNTIKIAATAARNGYQYRCIVKDSGGNSVTSNAATLTVTSALAITTQPKDVTAAVGTAAQMSVTATGTGLTYQWQVRTSSTGTWKNSTTTGYNTNTIKISATAARNGYQYRCIVKDSGGNSATSNAASLTVLAITTQPKNVTAAVGTTAQMSVTATGTGLTYQWQVRTGSTGTWKNSTTTGCTTNTIRISATAARNGYQYRCIVKDSDGNSVTSNAAALTVE